MGCRFKSFTARAMQVGWPVTSGKHACIIWLTVTQARSRSTAGHVDEFRKVIQDEKVLVEPDDARVISHAQDNTLQQHQRRIEVTSHGFLQWQSNFTKKFIILIRQLFLGDTGRHIVQVAGPQSVSDTSTRGGKFPSFSLIVRSTWLNHLQVSAEQLQLQLLWYTT